MRSGTSDGDRSVLGATLATVRATPRVLVFPLFAVVVSLLVFPILLWSITRSLRAAGGALGGVGPLALPVLLAPVLYVTIAAAIAILSSIVAFANVGVAQITLDMIDGRDASIRSGVAAALHHAPTVLLYGLFAGFAGTIGFVMERRSSARGRYAFATLAGETYTGLTYLLGPVAVGERLSATGTLYRGARLLRERFGDHPIISFTIFENVTLVAALPLVVVQTLLIVEVFGRFGLFTGLPRDSVMYAFGFAVVVLWVGVVSAISLAAIAKTTLYVAITEDLDELPLLGIPVDEAVTIKSTRDSLDTEVTTGGDSAAGADGDADD